MSYRADSLLLSERLASASEPPVLAPRKVLPSARCIGVATTDICDSRKEPVASLTVLKSAEKGLLEEKLDIEQPQEGEAHEADRCKLELADEREGVPTLHTEAEAARFNCITRGRMSVEALWERPLRNAALVARAFKPSAEHGQRARATRSNKPRHM